MAAVAKRALSFTSGDRLVAATLDLPACRPRAGVVPLHPAYDGSRRNFLLAHLAETLVPRGVAVLGYDRRPAIGDDDVPFAEQAADALAAVRALRGQPEMGGAPVGLWAWSQGAWAAPLAASGSDEVAFLVLVAAAGVSPAAQMRYGTAEQLRRRGFGAGDIAELEELRASVEDMLRRRSSREQAQAVVDRYAERAWFAHAQLPRTLPDGATWTDMDFDPEPVLARVRCPVLLVYGDEDEWTPIEPSVAAWRRAAARGGNDDVSVVRIAGAMHAPTIGGVLEADAISPDYTEALANWLEERLAAGLAVR
jgi:pimeloyl-ACP methyl ester carboxylesterase